MSALIILISASLLIAIGFLFTFLFSVEQGQFDDSVTPPIRMLFDDQKSEVNDQKPTPENK